MLTKKQFITTEITRCSITYATYVTSSVSSIKGFEAFSKDRKRAANAFRNPLETQFQVVSRALKRFGNPLETLYKPFESPLKTRFREFETLWKLFRNRLEALYKPGFRSLKPFGNSVSPKLPCLIRCCLLYTSPSPRDQRGSRMPSSA